MRRASALVFAFLLLAGCAGEEPQDQPPPPAPTPDGGTRAGHGADARQVRVPRRDSSPPTATIVLEAAGGTPLAEASQPGQPPKAAVELSQPRLRGTATGRDTDGGVARVRVSISELITCRTQDGSTSKRPRIRYFPPPQIERIRSNPGARLAIEASRTLPLELSDRCGGAEAVAVEGELWAEATNGTGLEAVTPHVAFNWKR